MQASMNAPRVGAVISRSPPSEAQTPNALVVSTRPRFFGSSAIADSLIVTRTPSAGRTANGLRARLDAEERGPAGVGDRHVGVEAQRSDGGGPDVRPNGEPARRRPFEISWSASGAGRRVVAGHDARSRRLKIGERRRRRAAKDDDHNRDNRDRAGD